LKILIVGHAISPLRGTEPGFTWNYATQFARLHSVWVIAQPEFRDEVESAREPVPPGLKIIWLDLPKWLDPWLLTGRKHCLAIHYVVWQRLAFSVAQKLHDQIGFDLVHHVSLGTVALPSQLWRLGIPFVWGPIGGGQTCPRLFEGYFRWSRWNEKLRALRLRLLPYQRAFRETVQYTDLILSTNEETTELLKLGGSGNTESMLDGALPSKLIPGKPITRETRDEVSLLFAGRLAPRKGLPLALRALREVADCRVTLTVAGDGPDRRYLQNLARKLGLENRVRFIGSVPWSEMPSLFRSADIFLFTSLRDSFGTVVLEALVHSLPVIALDHQGVATFIPDSIAIKVPVTNPSETIQRLATSIELLASSAALRQEMGAAGWDFARKKTWERRTEYLEAVYKELCQARNDREYGVGKRHVGTAEQG
jgi:glycosyltransferase involved in cell wall biosynthesis